MSGTFSELSTALSALRYNRVAMDVASGNISNASTDGYARRTVIGQATGAPAAPAIWSRWEGAGDGVEASRVDRVDDQLLDIRARTEHANSSYLGTRATSLQRFETTIGEPGANGVAAALADFQAGWQDVGNHPGDDAARSQLLARASTLQAAIKQQADAVSTEWSDQRTSLTSLVDQVNQTAQNLASLNRALQVAHVAGTDANTLLDRRDQLALKLSELTGATVDVGSDTTVTVTVGNQTLVSGTTANAMSLSGATTLTAQASNPVQLSLGGTPLTLGAGQIGATQTLLGGDLPGYLSKLDGFVNTLATTVNAQQAQGVDLNGATTKFFTGTTAMTLQVAITDPAEIAAATPGQGALDGSNADAMSAALDPAAADYRSLVTNFGVTVASTQQLSQNQDALTAQVDSSRESLSGVSIDEEMVNLMAAQRGYEGASRVLTTVDSMLDTLINRTGLVGR